MIVNKCIIRSSSHQRFKSLIRTNQYRVMKSNRLFNKPPRSSFASTVQLYDMSYTDIFVSSVTQNLVMYQIPSIVMYRMMKFSNPQILIYLLINAYLKTMVDLYFFINT